MAFAGRAWVIGGEFTVTAVRLGGYLAMGCGASVASGAMFAASGCSPRARLQLALHAAEAHDVHMGRREWWSRFPARPKTTGPKPGVEPTAS